MVLEDLTKISILFEKYSKMLTEKQCYVVESYANNNMSFGEIAENQNITRQAVKDIFSRTVKILNEFEQKLQLVKKDEEVKNLLKSDLTKNEKQLVNKILDI